MDKRVDRKARSLGLHDPLYTIICRYNTGGEYASAAINQYEGQKAAKETRKANAEGLDKQLAAEEAMYEKNVALLKPWTDIGTQATSSLSDLLGYNGTDKATAALDSFRTDPGYKFSVDQSNQALERSALAKGNLFSGNFATDLQKNNMGLADQQYSNYYNRLFNVANMGRGTATGVAGMNTTYGNTQAGLFGDQAANDANYANSMYRLTAGNAQNLNNQQQAGFDKFNNAALSIYGSTAKGAGAAMG